MIIVVDGLNRDKHTELLSAMHRLRARVFDGRLGWDVRVEQGEERDMFDLLDPTHIISVDDDGEVVGCMRLLQTTGPHMLADVFAPLLGGEPPLRSSRLWEATRFCVDTERLVDRRGRHSISHVTTEVMIGAFEYALDAGISDAVAVIDPVMHRVMKRSGNAPSDYLGRPTQMGKVMAMAVLMDVTEERIARLREFSGIHEDVFAPRAPVPAWAQRPALAAVAA